MVTPPLAGFILYEREEEVIGMLTAIGRAFDRFWNGPWVKQESGTTSGDREYDPAHDQELARRLAEEAYWMREHDEDDERRRHDEYTL